MVLSPSNLADDTSLASPLTTSNFPQLTVLAWYPKPADYFLLPDAESCHIYAPNIIQTFKYHNLQVLASSQHHVYHNPQK
jgi:hypothetical protein